MGDILVHYELHDSRARAVIVDVTESVRTAVAAHRMDPISALAVGRTFGCTATLASSLKHQEEYIHAVLSGDGPLKKVVAECNGLGEIRGYTAHPRLAENLGRDDKIPETVGEALGASGTTTVTRGRPGNATPYRTISELENGEIAADFARFFADSEQIPSAVSSGVRLGNEGEILAAGAVLIQRLGGSELTEEDIQKFTRKMYLVEISERLAFGESVEEIMGFISDADPSLKEVGRKDIIFRCHCSSEKVERALATIGRADLQRLAKQEGSLKGECPYCATEYVFTLQDILKNIPK